MWAKGLRLGKEIARSIADSVDRLWHASVRSGEAEIPLNLSPERKRQLVSRLEEQLRKPPAHHSNKALSSREKELVRELQEHTALLNRNNLTRTAAYLEFYGKHPEIHWALLAHMVSRNGGWNMTDLRGELLPRLLDEGQIESIFDMLETANALIFQDAFPQLLLYERSRTWNRPLFHLLPQLHVSRFMQPMWELFWDEGSSALITIALIINEQNYIQARVAEHPRFQGHALHSLMRLTQAATQTNQIILPCKTAPAESSVVGQADGRAARSKATASADCRAVDSKATASAGRPAAAYPGAEAAPSPSQAADAMGMPIRAGNPGKPWPLYGRVLENFPDLDERIEIGKQLYALLFGLPSARDGFHRFAREVPHSGSRADYWPHLFQDAATQTAFPSSYTERLNGCALREGASRLCSPRLPAAWPDRPLAAPERYDWFRDLSPVAHLSAARAGAPAELTRLHCAGLRKLELAILARELID